MRGGNLVGPDDKPLDGSTPVAPRSKDPDPEDDDNPFRPPADLRADDESATKKRKPTPTGPAAQRPPASTVAKTAEEKAAEAEKEKNKISFSIKGLSLIHI